MGACMLSQSEIKNSVQKITFSKIFFFEIFFGVFCKYTIVTFAQTQKINVFWKVLSLAYLEPFLFYQSGDFWRFRGDFRKKIMTKNINFFQFFFFQIFGNRFF